MEAKGLQPVDVLTASELLVDHWLAAQRSRGLRALTIAQYEAIADAWIVPNIGGMKAAALTPKTVTDLVEKLRTTRTSQRRDGLSPRSLQMVVGVLKGAYTHAVATDLLGRNPLLGVRRPTVHQDAPAVWSEHDARTFLAEAVGDPLRGLWTLALTRGLRRGELAGLRWDAVDLDHGSLRVVSTLMMVNGKPQPSGPKTRAGARTVPLDPSLVALLRDQRRSQSADKPGPVARTSIAATSSPTRSASPTPPTGSPSASTSS